MTEYQSQHRAPSNRRRPILAATAALVLVAGAFSWTLTGADAASGLSPLELAQAQKANCQLLVAKATSSAQRTRAQQCVTDQTAIINLLSPTQSPSGTPTGTPPPTASPAPTATASPTGSPPPTTPVPSPTTPSPTPTMPPPSPTPGSSWPTAGDTAAGSTGWRHTGVTLTPRTGLIHVTTPGTVLDSIEAVDGIEVQANNVTIRRSLVEGANTGPGAGIWIDAGVTGTLIEDVEVTSRPGADPTVEAQIVDRAITAFNTRGTVMRRVYAHQMIRGLQFGCDTLIEDSYVDGEVNPEGNHMSAVGGETCVGTFALTVRHNHIGLSPNPENSAALLYYPPQVGPSGDQSATIVVADNYITGGTYCTWFSSDPGLHGTLTVTNNRYGVDYYPGCGLFGALFSDQLPSQGGMAITWSGNGFADGRVVAAPHG